MNFCLPSQVIFFFTNYSSNLGTLLPLVYFIFSFMHSYTFEYMQIKMHYGPVVFIHPISEPT